MTWERHPSSRNTVFSSLERTALGWLQKFANIQARSNSTTISFGILYLGYRMTPLNLKQVLRIIWALLA